MLKKVIYSIGLLFYVGILIGMCFDIISLGYALWDVIYFGVLIIVCIINIIVLFAVFRRDKISKQFYGISVYLIALVPLFFNCSEAYRDGEQVAKILCYDWDSPYHIKYSEQYLYVDTLNYESFKEGFLDYLENNCDEIESHKNWLEAKEVRLKKNDASKVISISDLINNTACKSSDFGAWFQVNNIKRKVVSTQYIDSFKVHLEKTIINDNYLFSTHLIYDKVDSNSLLESELDLFKNFNSYFYINNKRFSIDSILKTKCCLYSYNLELDNVFECENMFKFSLSNICSACGENNYFDLVFKDDQFYSIVEGGAE